MRVVTPYRPFAPESREHLQLGPFDWLGAIAMLRASVTRFCQCETVAITDRDTTLPGPTYRYATRERRLMLWILEVSRCYLASPDFTEDTVMCSPDSLVFGDLRPWFIGDFGIVVRPDHARPILNSLQWWPVAARAALVALYDRALAIARTLPDDLQAWGADSEPFRQLLDPIAVGCHPRAGLAAHMVPRTEVLTSLRSREILALEAGLDVARPEVPVIEFRYMRKQHMRAYFDATIGSAVAV